jgi:hypothetical protein
MSERSTRAETRREFLLWVGGSVAALPILSIAACAPEEANPPPTTDDEPADTGPDPGTQARTETPPSTPAQPAPAHAEGLPKLDENSQTAQALGYKHDAKRVDKTQFPSRGDADSANELCKNCVQFQAQPDQEWGPCTIFPGKLVNANGWCSAYVAKG